MRPRTRPLLWMVLIGLALRLGSVAAQYHYHLNPALDHWRFGWEMGRVGRALALGQGFASPIYEPSGPTAWCAPIYPLLIASGMRLFGLYSAASAWFILSLNALFGALSAWPVYVLARRLFGPKAALRAGWLWTVLPYSIYICGERIWENTLTALLAASLLALTFVVAERGGWMLWNAWGVLWGVAGLSSPALLSSLPFLGLWCGWSLHRAGRPWLKHAAAAGLLFWLVLAPWLVRNERVFHHFVPVRDNLWLEIHVGNNGDFRQPCPDAVHPSNSAHEREQYYSLGETAYMEAKKRESRAWIAAHPRDFLLLTARRVLFVWTAYWSTSDYYLASEPMEPLAVPYFTALTLAGLLGLRRAWRQALAPQLWPLIFFLLIYPLPYYVTHPSYEYRHALDPVLVVLAVNAWPRAKSADTAS